jgi:hypothetical protein
VWKNIREKLTAAWKAWTRIAHVIGNFQARVLLTVLYVVLVFPFGVVVRLFADPLRIKKRPEKWLAETQEVYDLQWAQKQ